MRQLAMYPSLRTEQKRHNVNHFYSEEICGNATVDYYDYPSQTQKAICRLAGKAFSSRSVFCLYKEFDSNNSTDFDNIDWVLKCNNLKKELENVQSCRACVTVYTGSRGVLAEKVVYAVVRCTPCISTAKLSNLFSKSDSRSISEINEKLSHLRKEAIKKLKYISTVVGEVFEIPNPELQECCITDNILIDDNQEKSVAWLVIKRNMTDEKFSELQRSSEKFYQLFDKDILVVYSNISETHKNSLKQDNSKNQKLHRRSMSNGDLEIKHHNDRQVSRVSVETSRNKMLNKTSENPVFESEYLNSNENGFWNTEDPQDFEDNEYYEEEGEEPEEKQEENGIRKDEGEEAKEHSRRNCYEYASGKTLIEMDYVQSEKYIRKLVESSQASSSSGSRRNPAKKSTKDGFKKTSLDKPATANSNNKKMNSDEYNLSKEKKGKRTMSSPDHDGDIISSRSQSSSSLYKKENNSDKNNNNNNRKDVDESCSSTHTSRKDGSRSGICKMGDDVKLELLHQKQYLNQDRSSVVGISRAISESEKGKQYSFSLRRMIEVDFLCN